MDTNKRASRKTIADFYNLVDVPATTLLRKHRLLGADDFAGFWNYHHMLSGAEKRAKYYSYFLSRHGQLKEEESVVLFDEPENSNSMDTLGAFLVGMERVFLSLPNIQLFVATHSLYLIMHLLEKRAKLIELEPNYLKSQVNMYKDIINMYEKRS